MEIESDVGGEVVAFCRRVVCSVSVRGIELSSVSRWCASLKSGHHLLCCPSFFFFLFGWGVFSNFVFGCSCEEEALIDCSWEKSWENIAVVEKTFSREMCVFWFLRNEFSSLENYLPRRRDLKQIPFSSYFRRTNAFSSRKNTKKTKRFVLKAKCSRPGGIWIRGGARDRHNPAHEEKQQKLQHKDQDQE
jgi:hypothetical protein